MSASQAFVSAAAILAVACVTVSPTTAPTAPLNACTTDQQCAAYVQPGATPTCSGGICETTAQVTNWTALVSLSQAAAYAPGATFVITYSDLFASTTVASACSAQCPAGQACAQLPELATSGQPVDLEVEPQGALTAGWNLGNSGPTSLPVMPTLRAQVPAGLPVAPIQISETLNDNVGAPPGPGGGVSFQYSIAVPAATYEQTLMPMPPFDQAFPPDIRIVDLSMPPYPIASVHYGCDPKVDPDCAKFDTIPTSSGSPGFPTFDLSRADLGPLDGWVVFLADQTTSMRISNIVTLNGKHAMNVQLLTSHHPASQNALDNAELVMQPPASSGLPTAIFKAFGDQLGPTLNYPELPPPLTVSGKVVTARGGRPVPADVVFDVGAKPSGLCRVPSNSVLPEFDQNGDLTFTTTVPADDGSFQVSLPWGVFRATARPRDSNAEVTVVPSWATTVVQPTSNVCSGPVDPGSIVVDVQRTVRGISQVADGRPLAAATIEAIPTGCSDGTSDASCLPRASQSITADDGSYALQLDPGEYSLHARPAEGSALPWVHSTLSVASAATTPGPKIVIPAPFYAGFLLQDFRCNPVVEAVVRMYETPAMGSAFLKGEALTDSTGHYDMYLAPPGQ